MEIKPYSGNAKPYVFAAYNAEDADTTSSLMENIVSRGYALWPSEKFDKRRIDKAALVVLFLSPASCGDAAFNKVLNYATQINKPILAIYIAPTILTPAQKLMLNTLQGIIRYDCPTDEAFFEKLFSAPVLQDLHVTPAQKKSARLMTGGLITTIMLAVAAAVIFAVNAAGTVQADSLVADLGYSGRLADIEEIWVYGDVNFDTCHEKVIPGKLYTGDDSEGSVLYISDGTDNRNYGMIADLSDFSQLKNLKKLSLAGNEVSDITALYGLNKLEYLDLAANPISDLTGIGEMDSLSTLYIDFTNITDITPLLECKNLARVYVDNAKYEGFTESVPDAKFDLFIVGPSEEIDKMSCHIFGGLQEWPKGDVGYGVFVQTKSCAIYDEYKYEVYKNDIPIDIIKTEYLSNGNNGIMDKTHLLLDQNAIGEYDAAAVYKLVIRYNEKSMTYQIWHKYDENNKHAISGLRL